MHLIRNLEDDLFMFQFKIKYKLKKNPVILITFILFLLGLYVLLFKDISKRKLYLFFIVIIISFLSIFILNTIFCKYYLNRKRKENIEILPEFLKLVPYQFTYEVDYWNNVTKPLLAKKISFLNRLEDIKQKMEQFKNIEPQIYSSYCNLVLETDKNMKYILDNLNIMFKLDPSFYNKKLDIIKTTEILVETTEHSIVSLNKIIQYLEKNEQKNHSNESNNQNSNDESFDKKDIETEFFKGVKTKEEVKKRYKDLLKIYHPDNISGDKEISLQIQKEYDNCLKKITM